ncbi:MAG: LytTR family DNA-binding domain-containing protein [Pseudomonadota bacterium]
MPTDRNTLLDRYLRRRRVWEAALWIVGLLTTAVANSIVAWMEVTRAGIDDAWWEPVTWEFSSTIVLLALIPALVAFERRFPFHFSTWRRVLPWHVLGVLVFCAVHIVGMVALRKLVYGIVGGTTYGFGNWPRQFVYELMKDWRTYYIFLLLIYFYRMLLLRLQGEARLLTAPDSGAPLEAIDRPERFLVRKLGTEFLVAARDIEWLEASENYVNLHVRGRVYPLRSTMTGIQERLDPQRFVRVHRSHIVNLEFLEQIEPLETGDARVKMKDGSVVPCSRRYREALRRTA